VPESEPWKPFISRDDFEFADAILQAGMNKQQVETILDIICRIKQSCSDLSFSTYNNMKMAWEKATTYYPSVCLFIQFNF
jgi:hypothetical protein